jgi:predicted RNase H-like HicB family nuclease/uncharacterized damage-inducible protein DinB
MTTYRLVLESGPKHMKTFVHVLDLPGCSANGPTTEEALRRTPGAISAFLRLLARHGEPVDLDAPVEVEVARHVTQGDWLGNGSLVLDEDVEPLTRDELERQVRWAEWLREEFVALVEPLSDAEFTAKPERGRPIRQIVEHVFASEYSYVRPWGKLDGVPGPGKPERMARDELMAWIAHVRAQEVEQLLRFTDEELRAVVPAGSRHRTARRTLRSVVGHQWEHLVEVRERLGAEA